MHCIHILQLVVDGYLVGIVIKDSFVEENLVGIVLLRLGESNHERAVEQLGLHLLAVVAVRHLQAEVQLARRAFVADVTRVPDDQVLQVVRSLNHELIRSRRPPNLELEDDELVLVLHDAPVVALY